MKDILNLLSEFVTVHKKEQISKVLNERTRHVTVVLEDIFQPHNASAIVRTCDCFGIQELHIIENKNKYIVNPKVVMGASKWVDIYNYCIPEVNNTKSCLTNLKEKGYRIIATSPDPNCHSIDELNLSDKIALVFGISKDVIDMTDDLITIPMYGFTESFNISVSAALCLQTITQQLRKSDVNWNLTLEEKETIQLEWYKKIVNRSEIIIENYQQQQNETNN